MKKWSKPGYKTTEFAGATILSALSMIKGLPLPAWTAPLVWGLYVIARGMSKMGGPEIEDGQGIPFSEGPQMDRICDDSKMSAVRKTAKKKSS